MPGPLDDFMAQVFRDVVGPSAPKESEPMSSMAETKRENARQLVNVREMAEKIAAELPSGPWAVRPTPEGAEHIDRQYAHLYREDGAEFYIAFSVYPLQMTVRGSWPKVENWGDFAPNVKPSIAFNPYRDPKKLAGEIARRFLPDFLPEWEKQHAAAAAFRAQAKRAEDLAEELGEIFNKDRPRERGTGWFIWTPAVEVEVTRYGSVKFEVSVPEDDPAKARDLARYLAAWCPVGAPLEDE